MVALSSPRTDPTSRVAIERADRDAGQSRLMVSIAERCGEQLIEAFRRMAEAYYGRDVA